MPNFIKLDMTWEGPAEVQCVVQHSLTIRSAKALHAVLAVVIWLECSCQVPHIPSCPVRISCHAHVHQEKAISDERFCQD